MTNSDPNDGLVQRAVAGSAVAFAELVDRHAVPLTLFVRRHGSGVLSADYSAEDLLQSILLAAWESLSTFEDRGPGSFYGWLVQIARHTIGGRNRYQRAKGRDRAESLERQTTSGRVAAPEVVESMTSIASRAARDEQVLRLQDALAGFSDERRRIVELSFLEGRPLRDVAETLALPKSTVWDQLRLAMRELKDIVGDDRS